MRKFSGPRKATVRESCLKKYTGDMYGEKKHGRGVLSWADGRMYTGAFYADRRHGFGTFHTPEVSEFKVRSISYVE